MKLRFAENSLRLRVRKSDITKLAEQGFVYENISFGDNRRLRYTLIVNEISDIEAVFLDGMISISLPEYMALEWINSDQVGLERKIPMPNDQHLHILIEKDFSCLRQSDEDKLDTFQELVD